MVVLTLAYAITTILILCSNRRTNNLAKQQIELYKQQLEEEFSPYIIYAFKRNGDFLSFSIRNEGRGTAENTQVIINKINDLIEIIDKEEKTPLFDSFKNNLLFLKTKNFSVLPKQELNFCIGLFDTRLIKEFIKISPIQVAAMFTYKGKKKSLSAISIDLEILNNYTNDTDEANLILREISSSLGELNNNIKYTR